MAISVPIPAGTLPAGVTTAGPLTAPAGWHVVDVSLDVTNLVPPGLDIVVEHSRDGGATWLPVAAVFGATGPSVDQHGVLQTTAKFHISFGDSNVTSQVRGTVTNHGVPLVTAGGSLQAA